MHVTWIHACAPEPISHQLVINYFKIFYVLVTFALSSNARYSGMGIGNELTKLQHISLTLQLSRLVCELPGRKQGTFYLPE